MLKFEDEITQLRGEFALKVFRRGKEIDSYADHNLIVNVGRERLAKMVTGEASSTIDFIGLGSGGEDEAAGDTALTEQILLPLTGKTTEGMDARFDFTIGEYQANGLKIREFGLFFTDETMFSHRVRRKKSDGSASVIEKQDDITIQGYWIIHF